MYSEPASFEFYVPKGWVGEYLDFINLIPDEEKYWIDDINEDIFLTY